MFSTGSTSDSPQSQPCRLLTIAACARRQALALASRLILLSAMSTMLDGTLDDLLSGSYDGFGLLTT